MKAIIAPIILGLTLAVASVHADDRHHPENSAASGASADQGMSPGMGVMDMERIQERMREMQQIMARIKNSKDLTER